MSELELYQMGRNLITAAEHIIIHCRRQDYEDVVVDVKQFIGLVSSWAAPVLELSGKCAGQVYFPDAASITASISQIMQAQEAEDYVLLADYMDLSIKPMLLAVQEGLRALYGELGTQLSDAVYKNNTEHALELGKQLANASCLTLEETNCGYATVALEDGNHRYYLHSNVNPEIEAEQLVQEYYGAQYEEYIVIGCGLGYHISRLLACGGYIKANVYESNADVIKTCLAYTDYSEYFKSKRLQIVYDADGTKLAKALENSDAARVMLHAPSIRNMKQAHVREQIWRYYHKESGIRKMSQLLDSNFYQNRKNCVGNVDEALSDIAGKTVVLVAAGPSFSKNVEALRNCPQSTVVIAVSTIYRKLLELGIRPDYVIHSDAQVKTYWHLQGIEESIPLLLLSTGYEGCARLYAGPSYIIYQKGYQLAEEEAKREGVRTYETGGSVATVALDVAIQCGAAKVILMGQDLAYTDGLAHAKGVSRQQVSDSEHTVKVAGYDGGMVETSLVLSDLIHWFETYVKEHPADADKIINATQGGAKINGIRQLPLAQALDEQR